MASSRFFVTKSDGAFVQPCEPTPPGVLPLSSIDRIYFKNLVQETLHVFKHGREPAKVIRRALSKALVPYYPMAGRLVRSEHDGKEMVACTGDGVWFVEAAADCSLDDVNWLQDHPLVISKDQLLPFPPDPAGMIMMVQVTEFTCGGFVVGFRSDHALSDGIGTAQFLNAVAEIARGLERLTVEPVWCREVIPSPSPLQRSLVSKPCVHLESRIMDVSLDEINQLKVQSMGESGQGCSKFELLIARLWQCRTRAIGLEPRADVYLRIAANIRHLLISKGLPPGGGYYGNCIYPIMIRATSEKIAHASVVEIAGMIRDAKRSLSTEFSRWVRGELEDPYGVSLRMGYELLIVSDWSRVGFSEVDYGWGAPAYVAPVLMPPEYDRPPTCYIVKSPAPKQGFRLMTRFVKKEHLEALCAEMKCLV